MEQGCVQRFYGRAACVGPWIAAQEVAWHICCLAAVLDHIVVFLHSKHPSNDSALGDLLVGSRKDLLHCLCVSLNVESPPQEIAAENVRAPDNCKRLQLVLVVLTLVAFQRSAGKLYHPVTVDIAY